MGKRRHQRMPNQEQQPLQIPSEHRILPKEWFLWSWGVAVTILLTFLASRLTGAGAYISIVAMILIFAICAIAPLRHLPWISNAKTNREHKFRWGVGLTICILLTIALGVFAPWPSPEFRILSDGQQATLRNILAENPSTIEIAVPMQDIEADRYAEQFDAVFRRANWKVRGVDSLWESRPAVGMVVRYKKNAERSADFVISALAEIGLKPDKTLVPTDPSTVNNSDLMLLLGKKP